MGLLSKIFGGSSKGFFVNAHNPGSGWTYANRFNKVRGGAAGGYGAMTFKNIIDAHSDGDEIIDEFELDQDGCAYRQMNGMTCYDQAYAEAMQEAMIEAAITGADPEDLIDMDQVMERAYELAEELADNYIEGQMWIPSDILDWAYYDVSDHNS